VPSWRSVRIVEAWSLRDRGVASVPSWRSLRIVEVWSLRDRGAASAV